MTEYSEEVLQPPAGVGPRLRSAREARNLSRQDIAGITKIPERHLVAMEEGRFADLASRAYALGFTRTYARAVGLDDRELTAALRAEMGYVDPSAELAHAATYEPGDPVRVPSGRIAMMAAIAALVVIVAGFLLWPSPYGAMPDIAFDDPKPARVASAPAPARAMAPPVVLTALADGVLIEVADASGGQLFRKQMALGESYAVPDSAQGAVLRTLRPDQLQVRVGERALPPLAAQQDRVREYPLAAAALLALAASGPAPEPVVAPVRSDSPRRSGGSRASQPQRVVMAPVAPAPDPAADTASAATPDQLPTSTVSD